ncbi:MAG TPA: ABC-F family ATP-binding cassette domain-containing protein, partial [Gemmatimonadales bacterium]|nr:ABC-F family ATP-binding cassette domain-containing protein [Gemmatimonadales bacterium]
VGSVSRQAGLRIALLDQHRDFGGAQNVWDAAALAYAELFKLEKEIEAQGHRLAELGDACTPEILQRYADDLERFEHAGGYQAHARVDAVLQGLGFDPEEAKRTPVHVLSGGERGRLGLVKQLVEPSDLLLLDEPTNHLDLETTSWLEGYLKGLSETVIVVTHDRDFLERVVDHMVHLEGGTATPYTGKYSTFVNIRLERRLAQTRAFEKQASAIAREEDYIRRNTAGHNATNARGRKRRLDNIPRLTLPVGEAGVSPFTLTAGSRGGDQVLVAENVKVAVGDRVLLDRFSARVDRGDVIGFIGANGAGKSTLLKTLLGERPAEGGTVKVGDGTQIGYYQQDLGQVPVDKTIFDIIADLRPKWTRGAVQNHLGTFGFSGDTVLRVAGSLSGGEKARVGLAMMALQEANLLVFDEPTNHLDVESIESLEESLEEYEGTIILVSHDRALLRNLVTRVWALENGRIEDVRGTFDEWEAFKASRARQAKVAAAEAKQEAARKPKEKLKPNEEHRAKQADERSQVRAREKAEQRVHVLEGEIKALEAKLADPALYQQANGTKEAKKLDGELRARRAELDRAMEEWTAL